MDETKYFICQYCSHTLELELKKPKRKDMCKACYNKAQRQHRKDNPEKHKEYAERYADKARVKARERRYGITEEQYDYMFMVQQGRCSICSTKDPGRGHKHLHVDHCHTTGEVRGLLCDKCNRGLGYFDDDIISLLNAVEYLKRSI